MTSDIRNNLPSLPYLSPNASSAGFTLIEILIVMVIISALTAMVFPRMQTLLESIEFNLQKDDVLNQVAGLGYEAFQQATVLTLADKNNAEIAPTILKLPAYWHILPDKAIKYNEMGVCDGGELTLEYKQQLLKLKLTPPFCEPELL